jgi:hypothetical protein
MAKLDSPDPTMIDLAPLASLGAYAQTLPTEPATP